MTAGRNNAVYFLDTTLVTGGAGYVGSVVVEVLICEGFHVVIVDNMVEGHRSAVPDGIPLV